MAQAFFNVTTNSIGSEDVLLYTQTANTNAVLVGCNIANVTNGTLPVSLYLDKNGSTYHIIKNLRVPNGTNFEVMKGNKLILVGGDKLYAVSNEDESFDIILSLLDGIAGSI